MDSKMRAILLIDDEESIVNALRRELRDWATECSLEILTALSGKQGLEILERRGEDIIIVVSDLQMPGMSGSELLRRVKHLYPDIKSILLTGQTDMEESGKAAGIFGFVSKPWDSELLMAEIRRACEFGENRP